MLVDSPDSSRPPFPRRPGHRPSGFIALGDSYSAGIGTGVHDTETDCRRGLGAYPVLIHNDLVASEGANRTTFDFLSCTGSTIDDMLSGAESSQIDQLNTTTTADLALLSVGGNDLGFFDIMNSCIFRFYSFYSGTCEKALRKSREAVESPEFEQRLRLAIAEILDRVHWEKRPWFTVTVTGYARFFNAETEDCDERSFGVWWQGPKLRRKLRRRMNQMVLDVNDKIRRSVDVVNEGFAKPRVFFVDYDDAFEGHRFCEEGVIEPDYLRNETWFFLVGGQDNAHDGPKPPSDLETRASPLDSMAPRSPGIDPDTCLVPAQVSGDWDSMALCLMAMAARDDPSLRMKDGEEVHSDAMWFVPTYYGKTFHPVSNPRLQRRTSQVTDEIVSEHQDIWLSETESTSCGEILNSETCDVGLSMVLVVRLAFKTIRKDQTNSPSPTCLPGTRTPPLRRGRGDTFWWRMLISTPVTAAGTTCPVVSGKIA